MGKRGNSEVRATYTYFGNDDEFHVDFHTKEECYAVRVTKFLVLYRGVFSHMIEKVKILNYMDNVEARVQAKKEACGHLFIDEEVCEVLPGFGKRRKTLKDVRIKLGTPIGMRSRCVVVK